MVGNCKCILQKIITKVFLVISDVVLRRNMLTKTYKIYNYKSLRILHT